MMACPRCGVSPYLIVDGKEMSEPELLALPRAPRTIKRYFTHNLRCDSVENRLRFPLTGGGR